MQTPFGQNQVVKIALHYLSKSLNTEVDVSSASVSFFDELTLNDFLIRDKQNDTLVYAQEVKVDISLFSYFNKDLSIDKISLNGGIINLKENGTGESNYSFLINSTSSEEQDSLTNSTAEPWNLILDALELNETQFNYAIDEKEISLFATQINGLILNK